MRFPAGVVVLLVLGSCHGRAADLSLLARWKFDDQLGSRTAREYISFRDGDLSPTGAEIAIGGISGNALLLKRAEDGYAHMPYMPEIVNRDFSTCAWVKMSPGDTEGPAVVLSQHQSHQVNGFVIWGNAWGGTGDPGKVTYLVNSLDSVITSSAVINDGEWHHIATTYETGGLTRLYVDGVLAAAAISSPTVEDRGAPLLVGGLYGVATAGAPSGRFTGLIDDVQVYGGLLSEQQILSLRDSPGLAIQELEDPVVFFPNGGFFTNSLDVNLINNLGVGDIRYTLDERDPTETDTAYSEPLTIDTAVKVRARVYFQTFPISEVFETQFWRVYAVDDGVDNVWREQYFGDGYLTDPRVSADADPDNDGWNNFAEFVEGTDPTNPESLPVIVVGARAVPQLTWNSIPGLTYRVWRKEDASDEEWELVLPALEAASSSSSFIDVEATSTSIYQIELAP